MNSTSSAFIIPTAKVFEPLVKADSARYLGAWVAVVLAKAGSLLRS
jgi:hypothetical protein